METTQSAQRARNQKWYALNKEKAKEKSRARWLAIRPEPKPRAKHDPVAYTRAWHKAHPEKMGLYRQRRRAARLQAINQQDMELLALVEREAADLCALREAATGEPWEVDHIVPLRNKKVSGLHNPLNLRVITAEANRKKSNSFALDTMGIV